MSISYEAVVGVGLPYYELLEEGQDWDEEYDWNKMDMIQPYFDAERSDSYIAVVACKVEYGTIETNMVFLQEQLDEAFKSFKELTGKDGKLIISTNSW